jgi:hypothetical protein
MKVFIKSFDISNFNLEKVTTPEKVRNDLADFISAAVPENEKEVYAEYVRSGQYKVVGNSLFVGEGVDEMYKNKKTPEQRLVENLVHQVQLGFISPEIYTTTHNEHGSEVIVVFNFSEPRQVTACIEHCRTELSLNRPPIVVLTTPENWFENATSHKT